MTWLSKTIMMQINKLINNHNMIDKHLMKIKS